MSRMCCGKAVSQSSNVMYLQKCYIKHWVGGMKVVSRLKCYQKMKEKKLGCGHANKGTEYWIW